MSAELALQGALNVLWRGDAGVGAIAGSRVYDRVPASKTYPFVNFGEPQSIDEDTGCSARLAVFFDVHVWSREPGKVEALTLMGALRDALREADRAGTLAANGFTIEVARVRGSRAFTEPDGLTTHGVMTIEALVDPDNET